MELEVNNEDLLVMKERYLKVLADIILYNRNVTYYTEHNITTLADIYVKNQNISNLLEGFKKIPLTTYKDYISYIEKIYNNGECNVMSRGYPIWFAKSGGTTGTPKTFPIFMPPTSEEYYEPFPSESSLKLISAYENLKVEKNIIGLTLIWKTPKHYSPVNNVPVGFASSMIKIPPNDTEPDRIKYITNHKDHLKVSMLFNLLEENLGYICAPFINIVVDFFTILEENNDLFIDCLKSKRFFEKNELEDLNDDEFSFLDKKFTEFLKSRTKRCELLISILEKFKSHEDFEDSATKIWPNLKIICSNYSSITLEQNLSLSKFYTSKKVLYINIMYGCSECFIGTPSYLTKNGYKVFDKIYPEFIMYDIEKDEHMTTEVNQIWELELNKHYEIIVTTHTGYFRYKIGDVIKVTGWHDSTPIIEFVKRIGWSLVCGGYRLDDKYVIEGIKSTGLPLKHSVAYNNSSSKPAGFGFFVELESSFYDSSQDESIKTRIRSEAEEKINEYFSNVNEFYQDAVKQEKIGRTIINFVPKGTFHKYNLFKAKNSGSSSLAQIKIPISITDSNSIEFFEKASKNI